MSASASVLIMAGGTGGHVFPALAAAHCLRERGIHVEWLGTERGLEARVVPAAGFKLNTVNVSGLRGKGVLSKLIALASVLLATVQSLQLLARLKPQCVLGMGGYVSGPGGLAAWLTGRGLVLHEQNAVAGTANKMLSRLARRVMTGYPMQLGKSAEFIGNPVRAEITTIANPAARYRDRQGPIRLLVVGGSLGAKPINQMLPKVLASMPSNDRPEVWHQTGELHIEDVRREYQQAGLGVKAEAFIEDMRAAYEWADLVLCRSGALTVAEIAAAGVAAILVPLPHAIDDHQTHNALWLADAHAAVLLRQADMTVDSLGKLLQTLSDRQLLLTMATTARSMARLDAAEQLAAACEEIIDGRG